MNELSGFRAVATLLHLPHEDGAIVLHYFTCRHFLLYEMQRAQASVSVASCPVPGMAGTRDISTIHLLESVTEVTTEAFYPLENITHRDIWDVPEEDGSTRCWKTSRREERAVKKLKGKIVGRKKELQTSHPLNTQKQCSKMLEPHNV
jgi:hypothetical protein